jgi:two-component system, OmpR family, sensor histidine kinase KdpD
VRAAATADPFVSARIGEPWMRSVPAPNEEDLARIRLGVGLSISRSIVQSHGGSIEVANLPQGGARFVVHFPVD